jgi:phosphoribosylamine--glycine ligase
VYKRQGGQIVVKVDGLAGGKGAFPCEDELQALEAIDLIEKELFEKTGSRILLEEYLIGEEASVLAFSDGKHVIPLESAQDHKRAFDNDEGPNTGGMGAYSPAPVVSEDIASRVYDEILVPTIRGMASEGIPYKGILYAGLMITEEGPKVIEFNCRFGDPEAQAVIPRMATDIIRPIMACCDGTLDKVKFRWSKNSCVCVVLASGGYPGSYRKGLEINGLERIDDMDNIITYHAGTARDENGSIITSGGRVLGICGLGPTIKDTIKTTYQAVRKVKFEDSFYRKDIGRKATYHLDGM